MTIFLIILAIIVFCGIIRVIFTPSESILDFFLDIFFLDFLWDLFIFIISAIAESE